MERLVDLVVGAANGKGWTASTPSGGQSGISLGRQKSVDAGTSEGVGVNVQRRQSQYLAHVALFSAF